MASRGRYGEDEKAAESSDHPSIDSKTDAWKLATSVGKEKADAGAKLCAVDKRFPVGAMGEYPTFIEAQTDIADPSIKQMLKVLHYLLPEYIKKGAGRRQAAGAKDCAGDEAFSVGTKGECATFLGAQTDMADVSLKHMLIEVIERRAGWRQTAVLKTEDTICDVYIKSGDAQPTADKDASPHEGSTLFPDEESATADSVRRMTAKFELGHTPICDLTSAETVQEGETGMQTPCGTLRPKVIKIRGIDNEKVICVFYKMSGVARRMAVEDASTHKGSTLSADEKGVTTDARAHEGSTLSADKESVTTDASEHEGNTLSADEESVTTGDLTSTEAVQEGETSMQTPCGTLRPKVSNIRDEETLSSSFRGCSTNSSIEHQSEWNEGASRPPDDDASQCNPQELMSTLDVADAPAATDCSPLSIQDMLDMQSLLKQFGQCSYYILASGTLVLHLEDDFARNHAEKIKEGVDNIVRRRTKDKNIDVVVTNDACNSVLCSIGATLFVNDIPQTVGMYVDHGGLVYWVSAAHELLPMEKWKGVNYLCETTANMHLGQPGVNQVYLTSGCEAIGAVEDQRVRAPTPYACLSYNPIPGTKGELLMHYVDVMVGPMPIFTSRVQSGLHFSASSLHEVFECLECHSDTCRNPDYHGPPVRRFAISQILTLPSDVFGQYKYYDAESLVTKILRCQPRGQETISGKVISCQNSLCTRHRKSDADRYIMNNVLAIQPIGRVLPKEGDSGSVWVELKTNAAVAITVAMGETIDETSVKRSVWFAALLDANFEAFCASHPEVFPDPQAIKPIVPQPVKTKPEA